MKSKRIIGHILVATGEPIRVFAEKRGYTPQAIYDVLKGRTKTPKLRQAIAEAVGRPVNELWPE